MFTKINPLFFATVLLVLVMIDMGTWIYISQQESTFEASRAAYVARFPDFFPGPRVITFIECLMLGAAIYLFTRPQIDRTLNVLRLLGLILSCLLFMWLAFSLM